MIGGTITNTVAIINSDDMTTQSITDVGLVLYWATTGPDGKYCYVSLSGDNSVSVIDYETGDEFLRFRLVTSTKK